MIEIIIVMAIVLAMVIGAAYAGFKMGVKVGESTVPQVIPLPTQPTESKVHERKLAEPKPKKNFAHPLRNSGVGNDTEGEIPMSPKGLNAYRHQSGLYGAVHAGEGISIPVKEGRGDIDG